MKRFALLLIFVFPSFLFSQNYLNSTSTWHEASGGSFLGLSSSQRFLHKVAGDTIFNDKYYYWIEKSGISISIDNLFGNDDTTSINTLFSKFLLREENGIFYRYNTSSQTESALHDFNLSIGDTALYYSNIPQIVDSIETTFIGNIPRKKFFFQNNSIDFLTEGIGSSRGLLQQPFNGIFFHNYNILNCYFQNGESIIIDDFYECSNFPTAGDVGLLINEILPNGTIELKNYGTIAVEVADFWLFDGQNSAKIGNLNTTCGSTLMQAGDILVIDNFWEISEVHGELGLYKFNFFESPFEILDYVEWGYSVHNHAIVGQAAGIWEAENFTPSLLPGQSLQRFCSGTGGLIWQNSNPTSICEENENCQISGGIINTNAQTTFCTEGLIADFNVTIFNAFGPNQKWLLTDNEGIIIDFPFGSPFNFHFTEATTQTLYSICYESGIQGLTLGNSIDDLAGDFELSNGIDLSKIVVNGGEISTDESDCIDDLNTEVNIFLQNAFGSNETWIITDAEKNIHSFPTSPPFNFENNPFDSCFVYHLNYEDGLEGLEIGANVEELEGCFDLSNELIIVKNILPQGGEIFSTTNNFYCYNNLGSFSELAINDNVGTQVKWLVLDTLNNIILSQNSPILNLKVLNCDPCLVQAVSSFNNLLNAEVGNQISDISGCFALSNILELYPKIPNGGEISTDGDLSFCLDGVPNFVEFEVVNATGPNNTWVIANDQNIILEITTDSIFDLENIGFTQDLRVYHLSYEDGLENLEIGNQLFDLEGCFDYSSRISVNKNSFLDAGEILLTNPLISCGNSVLQPLDIEVSEIGNQEAYIWVVTNMEGDILLLKDNLPIDLAGANEEQILIYRLNYPIGLTGIEIGNNIFNLIGCFHFSNPIEIKLNLKNGGQITAISPTDICLDGEPDSLTIFNYGTVGNNQWVFTDLLGNITHLPIGKKYDLEDFGEGQNLIYRIAYGEDFMGLEIGNSIFDLEGCFDLSNSILITRNAPPEAGIITTNDPTDICADGIPDPINVDITGCSGDNCGWLVTNATGEILEFPTVPPFNFDEVEEEILEIYYISYSNFVEGLEAGNNLADLEGCFDLSNSITVTRHDPFAGQIGVVGQTQVCADGEPDSIKVFGIGTMGLHNWILLDANDNILDIPMTNKFDVEAFPPEISVIYRIAYAENLIGLTVGNNLSDLVGCYDLSNAISINFSEGGLPEAALISTNDPTDICLGGIPELINTAATGMTGEFNTWIVTEMDGEIIGTPNPPFFLEGDDAGIRFIYHLTYNGQILGLSNGNNISNLGGCFALSDPILVNIHHPKGGVIEPSASIEIFIDGIPDSLNFEVNQWEGSHQTWVITDAFDNILALPENLPYDFETFGTGICGLWSISHENDLIGLEIGNNLSNLDGCYDLSNDVMIIKSDPSANKISNINDEIHTNIHAIPSKQNSTPSFTIFPNPTAGNVTIFYKNSHKTKATLSIFDLHGKEVKNISAFKINASIGLNISDLAEGVYSLQIFDGEQIFIRRLVVAR